MSKKKSTLPETFLLFFFSFHSQLTSSARDHRTLAPTPAASLFLETSWTRSRSAPCAAAIAEEAKVAASRG